MIPNDRTFNGQNSYEFEGKTYYRWYYLRQFGDYRLHFKIKSTDSPHKQGISLHFSGFRGTILLNGKPLPVPAGTFKHYNFREDRIPSGEFYLTVHAESGCLYFANASERIPGSGLFTSGAFGCAFWIETLAKNCYRFHCNDHEYDDDFDDFIFDLEIIW